MFRSQLCFQLRNYHFPGNASPRGQKPSTKGLFHLQSYDFPGMLSGTTGIYQSLCVALAHLSSHAEESEHESCRESLSLVYIDLQPEVRGEYLQH